MKGDRAEEAVERPIVEKGNYPGTDSIKYYA